MKKVKKGDIIVRIGNRNTNAKLGKMYKTTGIGWGGSARLNGGWHINTDDFRFATLKEIELFNKGVKNVKDIPKTPDNYMIY